MPDPEKPKLTPAERRERREARRTAQRLANIGRAAKMHEARLAWEGAPELKPTSYEADIDSLLRRLLRLVLLALAGRVLSGRTVARRMVPVLLAAVRYRGIERALLFLADGCHRPQLAEAGGGPAADLHREGVRADYARETLYGHENDGPRLWVISPTCWASAWAAFSFSFRRAFTTRRRGFAESWSNSIRFAET